MDHYKQVQELVALGYEALKDRMQEVFYWIGDCNCTGYQTAVTFLQSLGERIIPHAREALRSDDELVRRSTMSVLVSQWPVEWVRKVIAELEAEDDINNEDDICCELEAMEILSRRRLGNRERLANRLAQIREKWFRDYSEAIEEIEKQLNGWK